MRRRKNRNSNFGIFSRVLPILARGARIVGKEAICAGANVLSKVVNQIPLKYAFNNCFQESGENLKRQTADEIANLMSGSDYKIVATNLSA